MTRTRTRFVTNPEQKRLLGLRAPKRRSTNNPGSLLLLGPVNPEKERTHMAKSHPKKKAGNPATTAGARTKKKHFPFAANGKKSHKNNPHKHHAKRAKNPNIDDLISLFKMALFALSGLLIARQVPQWLLKDKNVGWIGYGANLATALVEGAAATKYLKPQEATAVALGGVLYTVERVIREKLSPIGQLLNMSGVGDATAAATLGRLRGITIVDRYAPYPVLHDTAGNPIIPSEIDAQAAVTRAVAAAQKVTTITPSPKMAGFNRCAVAS